MNTPTTTLAASLLLAASTATSAAQPTPSSWQVLLADYSGDGAVDGADFLLWQSSVGDFDRNGVVDGSDFNIWQSNFGTSATPADRFDPASNAGPLANTQLAWGAISFKAAQQASADDKHKDWIIIESMSSPVYPSTATAGDHDDDGDVDGSDFLVWQSTVLHLVTLDVFLAAAGDFNADGVVDGSDFNIWNINLGSASPSQAGITMVPGDYTGDGTVDSIDYTVWRNNNTAGLAQTPSNLNDGWWSTDTPCPADINADGVTDNGDITAFIALFLAASPAADLNADTFLDSADIQTFIQAFINGC